jgi:single-stranded-DNA-specific exonuclease
VGDLNLIELFSQHSELFDRFGGHAMAAGLSLPARNLTRLREALSATVAAALPEPLLGRPLVVDAELSASTASRRETLDLLSELEPFGADHPEPVFISRSVKVLSVKLLPRGGALLRLRAAEVALEALTFETFQLPEPGSMIDLVYHLKRDAWRGVVKPRLALLDWRLAAA